MIGGAKGIGLGIDLGLVNQYNRTGSQSYIEPEVLDSLVGVWSAYGMTNDSPNRSTIKNKLSNKGGDFVISNAAFKLNSGFGKYSFDFERWGLTKPTTICIKKNDSFNITYVGNPVNEGLCIVESSNTSDSSIDLSFKVEITGLEDDMKAAFVTADMQRVLLTNGINVVNIAIKSKKWYGFNFIRNDGTALGNCNIVVRQIPEFQGAFVTDGIDDLITSTKTVQEMGITEACTVISMIHHIDVPSDASFNNVRNSTAVSGRNGVYASGTTGIYGWSKEKVSGASTTLINNILGDKNNYTNGGGGSAQVGNMKFSVQGFISDSGVISETSSVAWYWTIIANKVLTTDQINQVIAYFNLDRTLKPDILCNVKKQGITNENHAEFGDKLIDFSGNGRDIQLNNIAWNKESGIDDDGALRLDGVNDFGKVIGMPIYKDYTFISKYQRLSYREAIETEGGAVIASKSYSPNQGAFIFNGVRGDYVHDCYSFGLSSSNNLINDKNLEVYYQTKYTNQGKDISSGTASDSDILWVGTVRDNDSRFINAAIYFLMSFPYSMSEFLIERQLKKYKLGTLYPDMVEFRPVIKQDDRIKSIKYYIDGKTTNIGQYYPIGSGLGIAVETVQPYVINTLKFNGKNTIPNASHTGFNTTLDSKSPQKITMDIQVDSSLVQFNPILEGNTELIKEIKWFSNSWSKRIYPGDYITRGVDVTATILLNDNTSELTNATYGEEYTEVRKQANWSETNNLWDLIVHNIGESPQNINITIDEYIRYEDIVQPYPAVVKLKINERLITWGDKLKVGDEFIYDNNINLLPNMYNISATLIYNGNELHASHKAVVAKTMSFKPYTVVPLLANMPKCILSPQTLKIPNSSYRILGYIPDISGHGNHGKINNSAYAEGSGVNADGSYQLDGVDDFITIPTTVGGKQVLMKVNWQSSIGQGMLYDQRGTAFAIWNSDKYNDDETDTIPAYSAGNGGNTYIDGILNKNILASQLRNITHNIVATNTMLNGSSVSPTIGCRTEHDAYFTNMSLYDFMLFDEISTDEEILTLNEYVGIEGNTDDLFN